MLRDLFPRDHRRYEESRYGDELESFATWLSQEGHLRYPLRLHIHRVKTVLEQSDGLKSGSLFHEERIRQAFIVSSPDAYQYTCTGRILFAFWRLLTVCVDPSLITRWIGCVVAISSTFLTCAALPIRHDSITVQRWRISLCEAYRRNAGARDSQPRMSKPTYGSKARRIRVSRCSM